MQNGALALMLRFSRLLQLDDKLCLPLPMSPPGMREFPCFGFRWG